VATHLIHQEKKTFYFVTFTCYRWLPLFEITNLYSYIESWAKELSTRGIKISGYVIMPNHLHLLVYVEPKCKGLNLVMGEAKRFMAYKIVKRLTAQGNRSLLKTLAAGVQKNERLIGKKHQVFRLSFDAQEVLGEGEIIQVLDYIHHNPVSGKWSLVKDFTKYLYSSACYYESGNPSYIKIWDYRNKYSESPSDDSE